jgi:PAS domain S-box-containing protein
VKKEPDLYTSSSPNSPYRPGWRNYAIALAAVAAATAIRAACMPVLGNRTNYWTFQIALALSAWLGGLWPGLLATFLGAGCAAAFFVQRGQVFRDPIETINLAIFLFIGCLISVLSESIHRARWRAERAAVQVIEKDASVRNLLARTNDAIVAFDRHWNFIHANERAIALIARPLSQLTGTSLWNVFPHMVGSELQQRLTDSMTLQKPDRFESYFSSLSIWAETQVFPSPQGATLFISDTTAAHAAQRQRSILATINELARSSADGEQIAWAIVCEVGRLLGVSRCMLADVDAANGLIHISREYLDGVASMVGTHSVADFGSFMREENEQGRTAVVNDVETDARLDATFRQSCKKIQVAAFVAVVVMGDGRPVARFVVHSATTRQWSAEDVILLEQATIRTWAAVIAARAAASLRQSEERLRLALDAGQIGTWDWDVPTGMIKWSERIYDFYGFARGRRPKSRDEVLAPVHPDDREALERAKERAFEGDGVYQVEFRLTRPHGGTRWVYAYGSTFRDENGKPTRAMGVMVDITDRKNLDAYREELLASERAARADAEHAGRMKDEFLATLSHELRTPLNAILGWSQLIQAGILPENELRHGLETIDRNARVQTKLIEDLLDMSRIISGKVRLEMQQILLRDLATAAVATARPAAAAKEIALQLLIEDPSDMIMADSSRMQQVLWNLLTNAIKFTPRGGRVQLQIRRGPPESQTVEVVLTDSGQGIAPEFLPHVFDRLRQAEASITRQHGGLGLGLSIVKQLIEMHGGSIVAASDGPNHGAVFSISLPLAVDAQAPVDGISLDELPAAQPIALRVLHGLKVLLVEDESDARELVRRVLVDRGAKVLAAACAADAVTCLKNSGPVDVMVSDIGLPDEDGYALIQRLRAGGLGDGGQIPAIALTAYARPEDRARALAAGYQVYLIKPVEAATLVEHIATLAAPALGSLQPAAPLPTTAT